MVRKLLALTLISSLFYSSLGAAIPKVSNASDLTINDLADIVGGDPVCDTARRQVVATLRVTSRDVQSVATAGVRNTIVRNAVRRAQAGMKDATTGMTQVAFTLLAGDEPTKASRDLVSKGFGGVRAALDGIARASPAVSTRVTKAKTSLTRAITAGNKLFVDCGGSDPISIPAPAIPGRGRGRGRTIVLTSGARTGTAPTESATVTESATTTAEVSVITVTAEATVSTAVVTQTVVETVVTAGSDPAPTDVPEGVPANPTPTDIPEDIPADPVPTDAPADIPADPASTDAPADIPADVPADIPQDPAPTDVPEGREPVENDIPIIANPDELRLPRGESTG